MCLLVENKIPIEKVGGNGNGSAIDIGQTVKCVLLRAQLEKRIVVGLNATVKSLAAAVEGAVFCFVAPPKQGDAATLMHEVLLQAFCFENDIYVIKIDSSETLSRLLGTPTLQSCALVYCTCSEDEKREIFTRDENLLVDHCEYFWNEPTQPVIKLPEK